MTVASEITRLQTAKADIKTSVGCKWVTIPANAKLDQYAGYIDQIKVPDYSCWTAAYWLKATLWMCWYWSGWLCTQYSEINSEWNVVWLFSSHWWMWSSDCDHQWFHFLRKEQWCLPYWCNVNATVWWNFFDDWFYIYKHNSNNDCFLINRVNSEHSYGSWSCWCCSRNYYRLWVDFSVPCMTCLWNWSWCLTGACCGSKNCDNNPPGNDYTYIWTNMSIIKTCRWNKPTGILCTTIESSDHNNIVWAAVFR